MKIPTPLVAFLCSVASVVAPVSAAPTGKSILPNGSFEKSETDSNNPVGWPGGTAVSWMVEDGNRFLRISSSAPGAMDMLHMKVDIPKGVRALEHSYRARITGLIKGENDWYDARVIFNFKDAEGNPLPAPAPSYHGSDTEGWESFSHRFLLPEGAAKLEYMPSLFNVASGVFDIDDVVLRPIDHMALEKEQARHKSPDEPEMEDPNKGAWPAELFVEGNKVKDGEGREVWLQGLNIPSMEWKPEGENMKRSTIVAIHDWKANVIRLPLKDNHWFGKGERQEDGGKAYRELADAVIVLAANRGAYVIVDLHDYRAPREEHLEFWNDVATRYKNHPAVLFDLLNEPHGISWEIWRNGGYVAERKEGADEDNFLNDEERIAAKVGFKSPGMQKMLEVVRATGAKNVIVAGGLEYAYDLSGILKGYALEESGGNGIMYASHIYPWKDSWQTRVLDIAEHHPVLIGEVGADNRKQPWEREENFIEPETWVPDMLGLIQKHRLHWTGWSFHPQAGPRMLEDWQYTPTSYWGKPVKEALSGKQFELMQMR